MDEVQCHMNITSSISQLMKYPIMSLLCQKGKTESVQTPPQCVQFLSVLVLFVMNLMDLVFKRKFEETANFWFFPGH